MKRSLATLLVALPLAACSEPTSTAPPEAPEASVAGMLSDGGRDSAVSSETKAKLDEIRSSMRTGATSGAPRELLGRLPADTLFVLRLPHLELLGETWDRTAFSQSLANIPGLPPGVDPFDVVFGELRKSAPMMGGLIDLLPELHGELLLALTSIEPAVAVGEAPFTAMVLLDVAEQGADLKRALEPAVRSMSELPGFERSREGWGFDVGDHEFRASVREKGGVFTACVGSPKGVAHLLEEPPEGSFLASMLVASTPDFEAQGKPVVLEAFLHTAPVWQLASALMPPDARQALQQSGMFEVQGAAASMALADRGLSEVVTWCSPGRTDMLSRALSAKPINPAFARFVPSKVDNASIASFDFDTFFGDIIRILPDVARDTLFDRLGELEQSAGADINEDLFQNFGPTLLCLSDGTPEEWMMRASPKIACVVEVESAAGAKRLVAAVKRAVAGAARTTTRTQGNAEVTSFLIASGDLPMPIKISVAVTEGLVVVSADETLLEEVLATVRVPSDSKLAEELDKAGVRAWCVATGSAGVGLPAMTAIGTADEHGLRMESRQGSGALVLGGLAGGLAIPAAIAIPKLMSSRVGANEAAAVAMLRSIGSAQGDAYESIALDADRDGKGEALLLHELTGRAEIRGTGRPLNMVLLSDSWQQAAPGTASKAGYVFRVDLPATRGGGTCVSRELNGSDISTDGAERAWVAYAWPLDLGSTGTRAFALDQSGQIWFTDNRGAKQAYSGFGNGPAFDAFFSKEKETKPTFEGRDGGTWNRLQ